MSGMSASLRWPAGVDAVVGVLAAMLWLVPAVGVPSELVLQDTLKSALVAFATLGAALLLCWQTLRAPRPLRWHPLLCLPLLLLVWALGSMAWSHTYLAGVEAVRWFVFVLLLWLGLNTLTLERLGMLATGIHWGAVLASLWVALQFWLDLRLFPQLPPPGSTFLNRNFYAEYVLCTLPFSVLLAAQAQGRSQILLRVFSTSFNVLALLLTGTRSALLALLVLLPVLLLILWRYRTRLEFFRWERSDRWLAGAVMLGTLLGLGSLPTGNAYLTHEGLGQTALERAFIRGSSLGKAAEYSDTGSSGTRLKMWQATLRLIADRPVAGVGAGAWEVEVPRYQAAGTQLETDYYVHNEYLQLLAEYGVAGWVFALLLGAYLLRAARWTWTERGADLASQEAPWRAILLASLLGLFIVSGAGFPWRLASTGALFALSLGALTASDRRLATGAVTAALPRPGMLRLALVALSGALALAVGLSALAVAAETRLVRAAQLAYAISSTGAPDDPRWQSQRQEMLRLVREGVALHPHYRKVTPLVADELAAWGDWENARWIWASVLESRPHVVALLANLARANIHLGDLEQAQAYYDRAMALRPDAPSLRSVEIMLLLRRGEEAQALTRLREHVAGGQVEADLVEFAYVLGLRHKDFALALESQRLRRILWPDTLVDSWLKTGSVYAGPDLKDRQQAQEAFQAAWRAAPEALRPQVRQLVPPDFRDQLR